MNDPRLAGLLILVLTGCASIQPGERGVLFTPLASKDKVRLLSEGTYGVAPWDTVVTYDLRWRSAVEKADVQTSDKLHMVVPISIVYRPRAEKIVELHQALGPSFYETTVKPALLTATRSEFAHRSQDIVVPQAQSLQKDILEDVQQRLAAYDIEVAATTFLDMDYPAELARTFERRMVTEQETRNAEAALALTRKQTEVSVARATGEAEVASVKARGDAEARLAGQQASLAVAKIESQIVETRAGAEANSLRLRSASPALLKLQSIEAQRALATSPSSKVLIVVPSSKEASPLSLHLGDPSGP